LAIKETEGAERWKRKKWYSEEVMEWDEWNRQRESKKGIWKGTLSLSEGFGKLEEKIQCEWRRTKKIKVKVKREIPKKKLKQGQSKELKKQRW
jgi:hypothetical protein